MRIQAFRMFVQVNMQLPTYRQAAYSSLAWPMFSKQYMGTHFWPSDKAKRTTPSSKTVPRCLEQIHMQAVINILRKQNLEGYLYQHEKFYNVVRRKFSSTQSIWKQQVYEY